MAYEVIWNGDRQSAAGPYLLEYALPKVTKERPLHEPTPRRTKKTPRYTERQPYRRWSAYWRAVEGR